MGVEISGGRWFGRANEVVVMVRRCVRKREAGDGVKAKIAKLNRWGSISSAPSEMGVEISGGRWCGGADEVVVVVGRCVCKREAGEGAEGQKIETKP